MQRLIVGTEQPFSHIGARGARSADERSRVRGGTGGGIVGIVLMTPAVVVVVVAQASDSTLGAWTVPRTADGHPDLNGVWLSNTATPLQRPAALAGREHLTDEEVAELQARVDRIFANGRSAFAGGDSPECERRHETKRNDRRAMPVAELRRASQASRCTDLRVERTLHG